MIVTVVVSIQYRCSVYVLNTAITDPIALYCSCVSVAIIFHNHIAWLLFVHDSLFVRWSKHDILANAIDAGIHGPLFVATDVECFDCVHMLLGALQR